MLGTSRLQTVTSDGWVVLAQYLVLSMTEVQVPVYQGGNMLLEQNPALLDKGHTCPATVGLQGVDPSLLPFSVGWAALQCVSLFSILGLCHQLVFCCHHKASSQPVIWSVLILLCRWQRSGISSVLGQVVNTHTLLSVALLLDSFKLVSQRDWGKNYVIQMVHFIQRKSEMLVYTARALQET